MELGYFETSLNVQDIAATMGFYQKLGFEQLDGGVDIRNVSLQKGGCRLGLFQGYLDPARTQLIFWQGDIDAIAGELKARGVAFFRGPNQDEHGKAFMLLDPDDNPIYVLNLPVFHFNDPAYARPAEATPRTAKGTGTRLGRFILGLAVRDLEASLAFYAKLGFQLYSRQERVATIYNGDCTLSLYQGIIEPDRTQLLFWQGDIGEIADFVRSKGLPFFREPSRDNDGEGFLLKDPDGHTLHVINVVRLRPPVT
jgi:catechol 2,3-dioxygenase-like lactoylglutathione lyase family enzyme